MIYLKGLFKKRNIWRMKAFITGDKIYNLPTTLHISGITIVVELIYQRNNNSAAFIIKLWQNFGSKKQ